MRARSIAVAVGSVLVVGLGIGVAGAQSADTRTIASLHTLRLGICQLYAETGLGAQMPRFCPPPEPRLTCEKPLDPGPCKGVIARFGFDPAQGACVPFHWGGCGGNENRFETLADCEAACRPDACAQRIDPGPCDAAIARYGFDATRGECTRFLWGGCQTNGNNFETLAACEEACTADVDVCSLPSEVGPCDAAIPRWAHDPASGRCERFVYGGCGGNANNFETLAECEDACLSVPRCELPADPGPCRAAIARWAHDPESGACKRFVWGGCAGNDNNFATLAECERSCGGCDASLCGEHQTCQLFRDPACRSKQDRCERLCSEGCPLRCDPVPFCADSCEEGACPRGTRCELVEVQCVREPCPPVRRCTID